MSEGATATQEQITEAVKPENSSIEHVLVGGKSVPIIPLKRRWHSLFQQAALPMFGPELAATEAIQKAIADGSVDFQSVSKMLMESEVEVDRAIDRVAAVILASQIAGAEKTADTTINEQMEWIKDNCMTEDLRKLVEKQMDKERLIELVGERLPARFVRSLHLVGRTDVSIDTVRQRLTSSWLKPEVTEPTGAGTST